MKGRPRFAPEPPDERAEDDVELEPLALVHGNDPHRLLVALEAQLVFFAVGKIFAFHLLPEPFQEAVDPEAMLDAGRVQDFREMEEVR